MRIEKDLQFVPNDNPNLQNLVLSQKPVKIHEETKVCLNEKKLTTVVVKGEHVSTKSYIKKNPYIKASLIQLASPKEGWQGKLEKYNAPISETQNQDEESHTFSKPSRYQSKPNSPMRSRIVGHINRKYYSKPNSPISSRDLLPTATSKNIDDKCNETRQLT